MAINIISGNLNQWGNAGNFETDPSTWGFSNTPQVKFSRAYGFGVTKGIASCQSSVLQTFIPVLGLPLASAKFNAEAGKKYIAKANITTLSSPVSIGDSSIQIGISGILIDSIENNSITVGDCTNTITEVSLKFSVSFDKIQYLTLAASSLSENVNQGALSFVDQFEIYEYEDVLEPECDIAIDTDNTVVTDETTPAAGDGSITVAHTGTPRTTLEYSKDGGSTWQSSNQFTGLDDGIYNVVIRETGDITCSSAQSFSVNAGTASFDFTTIVTHETIEDANNGQIEVTVTGTGSPFTYSNDGGATYQGSNIFSNLSPTTYVVVVKDTSGNTVSKNVTVNEGIVVFGKAHFSKNLIPFTLQQTANSGEENYKLFNKVQTKGVSSGAWATAMDSALVPDSNGQATFNNRPAFRDLINPAPPAASLATWERVLDTSLYFRNRYGDIYDDKTVPDSYTTTDKDLVLLGGIDKRRFPNDNYFTSYLTTNKKMLTWLPKEQIVDSNQEQYIHYYVFNPATTKLKRRLKAYFDDNTNQTDTLSTGTANLYGRIYRLPVGPTNSGALAVDPAKNLTKYEIWLEDIDDNVISEVMVFHVSKFKPKNTRYLLFLNSLGGWDVLRMTGKATTQVSIQSKLIEKHLDYDYQALDGQFQTANNTRTIITNYSTGFYTGRYGEYMAEYLQEVAMSTKVFDITTGERVPITIQPGTFTIKQDDDHKYFMRFNATSAYQDEVFTPQSLPLLGS